MTGGNGAAGACQTRFEGLSVWLELDGLSARVEAIADQLGLHAHPPHLTLLYNFSGGSDGDEASALERFQRAFTPHNVPPRFRLRGKGLEWGISRLFGHAYIDLMFHPSPQLTALFNATISAFGEDPLVASFANSPHAALAYAPSDCSAVSSHASEDSPVALELEKRFDELFGDAVEVRGCAVEHCRDHEAVEAYCQRAVVVSGTVLCVLGEDATKWGGAPPSAVVVGS